MAAKTLTIDGKHISAEESATILQAAHEAGINIPTLCHLDGVYDVGACRLCLVEVVGHAQAAARLHHEGRRGHGGQDRQRTAAQISPHDAGAALRRAQPRLRRLRRQRPLRTADAGLLARAWITSATTICFPKWDVDTTHRLFGMDHNRCILCTPLRARLLAHRRRGHEERLRARRASPTSSPTSTSPGATPIPARKCGKCVQSCPTGALFHKGSTVGEMERDRGKLEFIVTAREKKQWITA